MNIDRELEWKSVNLKASDLITVCAACKRACCWQGEFMCDESYGADVEEMTVSSLRALGEEHEEYWKRDVYERGRP